MSRFCSSYFIQMQFLPVASWLLSNTVSVDLDMDLYSRPVLDSIVSSEVVTGSFIHQLAIFAV